MWVDKALGHTSQRKWIWIPRTQITGDASDHPQFQYSCLERRRKKRLMEAHVISSPANVLAHNKRPLLKQNKRQRIIASAALPCLTLLCTHIQYKHKKVFKQIKELVALRNKTWIEFKNRLLHYVISHNETCFCRKD